MTTSLSTNRRTVNEVNSFHAPAALLDNLQKVLVDLIELHLQGKQAHWNVVGTNFRDLHLQLDGLVEAAREASDTIAERMRALDAVPDGRSDTVVATTTVPAMPPGLLSVTETVDMISLRIYAVVGTLRDVHDEVDAADPATADLLQRSSTSWKSRRGCSRLRRKRPDGLSRRQDGCGYLVRMGAHQFQREALGARQSILRLSPELNGVSSEALAALTRNWNSRDSRVQSDPPECVIRQD